MPTQKKLHQLKLNTQNSCILLSMEYKCVLNTMSNTLLSQVTNTWKPRYLIGLGHLGKAYLENKLVYKNKNLTEYLN